MILIASLFILGLIRWVEGSSNASEIIDSIEWKERGNESDHCDYSMGSGYAPDFTENREISLFGGASNPMAFTRYNESNDSFTSLLLHSSIIAISSVTVGRFSYHLIPGIDVPENARLVRIPLDEEHPTVDFTIPLPIHNGTDGSLATNKVSAVFLIGGFHVKSDRSLDYFQIFDIETNSWSVGPVMPVHRARRACGFSHKTNTLFCFGGWAHEHGHREFYDDIHGFSFETNEWNLVEGQNTEVPMSDAQVVSFYDALRPYHAHIIDTPDAKGNFPPNAFPDHLFLMGGKQANGLVDYVHFFSPEEAKMETLSNRMTKERVKHSCQPIIKGADPLLDFRLVCLGGVDGEDRAHKTFAVTSLILLAWVAVEVSGNGYKNRTLEIDGIDNDWEVDSPEGPEGASVEDPISAIKSKDPQFPENFEWIYLVYGGAAFLLLIGIVIAACLWSRRKKASKITKEMTANANENENEAGPPEIPVEDEEDPAAGDDAGQESPDTQIDEKRPATDDEDDAGQESPDTPEPDDHDSGAVVVYADGSEQNA